MQKSSPCELLEIQHLLGGKWSFPLLLEFDKSKLTFNDLKGKTNNKINTTLLSKVIKDLLKHNVIEIKESDKKYYSLTSSGKKLIKILKDLKKWAESQGIDVGVDCVNRSCFECGKFI